MCRTSTRCGTNRIRVECDPVDARSFRALADEWREFSQRAAGSPFLTHGWLAAWVAVYKPQRLRLLRVSRQPGETIALGLLEERRMRKLRFAGGAMTPVRSVLVARGHERATWTALSAWIDGHAGWTQLEACGVDPTGCAVHGAHVSPSPWYSLDLPSTFEEYLAARSPSRRREFRRILRNCDRAGLETRIDRDTDARTAISTFVELHRMRAAMKGEVHTAIDDRLADLLSRVAASEYPTLRAIVLEQDDRPLAVAIEFEHLEDTWAYNTGFDPAAARFSPGILLELVSIQDQIERGRRRLDLGPGESVYKQELGGKRYDRVDVGAISHSTAGALVYGTTLARHWLNPPAA